MVGRSHRLLPPRRAGRRGAAARVGGLALALLAGGIAAPTAAGQRAAAVAPEVEYRLKAEFLKSFCLFVEWPADAFAGPAAPIVIGIAGDDPFGSAIDKLVEGVQVGGRALWVLRVTGARELAQCHVLFVTRTCAVPLPRILAAAKGAPLVVVGERRGFVDRGGTISFRIRENELGFEVNADAAARTGLALDSRFLKLATRVLRTERTAGRPGRPR